MPQPLSFNPAVGSPGFLAHQPLAGMETAVRARIIRLERSKTCCEPRTKLQMSPLELRRSMMAAQELPIIGNNSFQIRSKSAPHVQEEHESTKCHANVARVCDWSNDLSNCFSVSRLYREIANTPRTSSGKSSKVKTTCDKTDNGNEVRIVLPAEAVARNYAMSPSRMFIRDKKTLTRGEREIIEGIYKNRGDISREAILASDLRVRSHHEAWYAGKTPFGNTRVKDKKVYEKSYIDLDKDSASDSWTSLESLDRLTDRLNSQQLVQGYSNAVNGFAVKKPVFQLVDENCTFCQVNMYADVAKEVPNEQDCNKEIPSAPPGTPDLTAMHPYPLFDKLLHMRPVLSFTPASLTDRSRARCRNHSQIKELKLHQSKTSHIANLNSVSGSTFRGAPVFLSWVRDGFSVLSIHSSVAAHCHVANMKEKTFRKGQKAGKCSLMHNPVNDEANHTWIVPNTAQEKGSDKSSQENKKVKVNVYVPTAETDKSEDGIICVLHSMEEIS